MVPVIVPTGVIPMALQYVFWILMLFWLIFGLAWHFSPAMSAYGPLGSTVLLFFLFLVLGWKVFGPPLQG